MERPEWYIKSLSDYSQLIPLRQMLSQNPKLTISARLASDLSESICLFWPHVVVTGKCSHAQLLLQVLGIRIQNSLLIKQAVLPIGLSLQALWVGFIQIFRRTITRTEDPSFITYNHWRPKYSPHSPLGDAIDVKPTDIKHWLCLCLSRVNIEIYLTFRGRMSCHLFLSLLIFLAFMGETCTHCSGKPSLTYFPLTLFPLCEYTSNHLSFCHLNPVL